MQEGKEEGLSDSLMIRFIDIDGFHAHHQYIAANYFTWIEFTPLIFPLLRSFSLFSLLFSSLSSSSGSSVCRSSWRDECGECDGGQQ